MMKECCCESMQEITELRCNGKNPQTKWKEIKEDIKRSAIKKIEEERKKAHEKNKRSQKRHGDPK